MLAFKFVHEKGENIQIDLEEFFLLMTSPMCMNYVKDANKLSMNQSIVDMAAKDCGVYINCSIRKKKSH